MAGTRARSRPSTNPEIVLLVDNLDVQQNFRDALVRHPGIDKVSFTGSTATGSKIGAICGEQIKRCTLELGGKSAAILLEDVDIAAAVGPLLGAALLNNGQACGAQTRILAPRSRYGEISEALAVFSFTSNASLKL